jgi:hypothetical protein
VWARRSQCINWPQKSREKEGVKGTLKGQEKAGEVAWEGVCGKLRAVHLGAALQGRGAANHRGQGFFSFTPASQNQTPWKDVDTKASTRPFRGTWTQSEFKRVKNSENSFPVIIG